MRAVIGVGLWLLAFTGASFANDNIDDESFALISGNKIVETPAELPENLEVPAPWLTIFHEAFAKNEQLGVEHGTCLTLQQDANSKQVWGSGPLSAGTDGSVSFAINGPECAGVVSDIHSHPGHNAFPSERDIAGALQSTDLRSRFIVSANDVCALIKTKASNPEDAVKVPGNYSMISVEINSALIRDGKKGDDYNLHLAIPRIAERFGLGLYCSKPGDKLKKMRSPSISNLNDPTFVLMMKGLVLAEATYYGSVPFTFTPDYDNAFRDYQADVYGSDAAKEPTLAEAFRRSVEVSAEWNPTMAGPAVSIPDPRDLEKGKDHFEAFCSYSPTKKGAVSCSVFHMKGPASAPEVFHTIAFYDEGTGKNFIVEQDKRDHGTDKYKMRSVVPGEQSYTGECKFIGINCKAHGVGKIHVEGKIDYEGSFKEGDAWGSGVTTFLDSGEVWNVKVGANGMEFIKRIK